MLESTQELQNEIAGLIITTLNLGIGVNAIDVNAALYGEGGLGLDSIDILEIALVISKKYGFQLRANNENNVHIFSSLANLAAHVAVNRVK